MLSLSPNRAGAILIAGLLAISGCKEPLSPDKKVSIIEISPKSAQLYAVGQEVTFSTTLTTEAGTAGEGIEIGYIARDPSLIQVNSSGVAKALKKGGSTYVVAQAGGKSDSALVEVPLTTCGSVAATPLITGQVSTEIGATGFCAAGSTGEYTVVVHNNSLLSTGTGAIEITAVGVGNPPATSGPSLSKAPAAAGFGGMSRFRGRDIAAEMQHRRNEAAAVAPGRLAARAWYANRPKRASFETTAPAVGDAMTINVNIGGSNGCTDARTDIAARVAAVSNSAIVLADPRNPAGGFTDTEYGQFAAMFDSIINPLDVAQFGAPTDLDGNQRVLLVFTKAVNERTPAGAEYYVGGLTHSRDLRPKSTCQGSNEAEMFYLLVPDPNGTVNTNQFPKDFVNGVTDATVAHEFQHLINFARRQYLIPGALPSEELWLNEGLSHIAEELLYLRRSGRPARSNIGYNEVVTSQAVFTLFADYMAGNFLNYHDYAAAPTASSPFGSGDATTIRGATWSFLRYAADQKLTADGTLWYDLVNSGQAGANNLQNRLGIDAAALRGLLRDFTIAVYADDYVQGIPAKYTHPSWNMRSVYPGLQGYPAYNYPLAATPLVNAQIGTASISAGGFKLYRFTGLSGTDSFVRVTGATGSALPSSVTISVVRTK
ncbi:MAG TPA: hypothetical protein VFO55_06825 [Gemmatimonadaceae bacterium]|nr:hypothetical protein [Gemmatimonadaceae bacterium]